MPLKILIVGAGIGGLTAAIALREQGHEIIIFEQSQFASEYGAAIHIQPNANGILRRLGIFLEDSGANSLNWMTEYTSTGSLNRTMDLIEVDKIWHHPWLLAHRVQLHSHLKSKALTPSPPHPPITLLTSHKVTTLNPSTSTLEFSNGRSYTGDLIIGADGVHSLTRSFVQTPGTELKPFPCGKSAYRFLLSRSSVLSNPKTAKYMQKEGELIMWFGLDRRVIVYPTSSNSLLNFVCLHPDSLSEIGNAGEGWGKGGDKKNLLKIYEGWDEDMLEMLKMAPESTSSDTNATGTLKVWRLLDMHPLPTFTKENLVLLGDAAHPYLPHQGQGAGSAIEDAAALAVVLPGNVKREEIRERLKLYQDIRMGRAHRIQEFSRVLGKDPEEGSEVVVDIRQFVNHNLQHDEWDNSTHELRKWMWKRNPHLSTYHLIPAGFGPLPIINFPHKSTSQPQNIYIPIPNTNPTTIKTTAILTFTTSRTLLQNFFPIDSSAFHFINPGIISKASLRYISWALENSNENEKEEKYEQLLFCIEDVEYILENGEVVRGTFVPIVFGDSLSAQSTKDTQNDISNDTSEKNKNININKNEMERCAEAETKFETRNKIEDTDTDTGTGIGTRTYTICTALPESGEEWGAMMLSNLEVENDFPPAVSEKEKNEDKNKEKEKELLLLWRYSSNSNANFPSTDPHHSKAESNKTQGHLQYLPSPFSSSSSSCSSSTTNKNKTKTKKYTSRSGSFNIKDQDQDHLSVSTSGSGSDIDTKESSSVTNMKQIISRLAEVSCYEVLGGSVEVEVMRDGDGDGETFDGSA